MKSLIKQSDTSQCAVCFWITWVLAEMWLCDPLMRLGFCRWWVVLLTLHCRLLSDSSLVIHESLFEKHLPGPCLILQTNLLPNILVQFVWRILDYFNFFTTTSYFLIPSLASAGCTSHIVVGCRAPGCAYSRFFPSCMREHKGAGIKVHREAGII